MSAFQGAQRLAAVVFALLTLAGCNDAPRKPPPGATKPPARPVAVSALIRLRQANDSVQWDAKSATGGDVDCDGKPDSAYVGHSDSLIYVGLVASSKRIPEILAFHVGAGVQAAVCSSSAQLSAGDLDYDTNEEIGELPGFQRSQVCKGLDLEDGDCDGIHMYWDHQAKSLSWWRL